MTEQTTIPDPGAFEGSSPAPAHTNTQQPAARTSGPGQAEKDSAGVPRWNAPADPTGERAQWDAQQRARLGHAADPEAAQSKPDKATKSADGADTTVRVGNTTITEAEISEFLTNKAARESGRLTLPKTPDEYKIELPKDFKAPQGVEVVLNQNDPAFGMLKNWAHRNGLPQSEVSELIGIYGGVRAGELAIGKMAYETEVGKLGAAGPQRVDALAMWMRGVLGDRGAVLTGVRGKDGNVRSGVLWTAGIVEAFEALQQKFTGGGSHYTGNGRDMGNHDAGKIPNYAGMSFEQRRHAQEQRRLGGR
jgi:hypothetical protein